MSTSLSSISTIPSMATTATLIWAPLSFASTASIFFPSSVKIGFAMLALVCLGADLIRQKRPKADPYNTSWTVICSLLCDPWCVYIGWSAYGALASSTYVPSYTPLGTTLTLPLPLIQLCQFQGARQAVSLICEFLYRKFDTNMLIHHVGFLVALACTPTGYTEGILSADGAYFFGGLSELSTIVLGWKLLINEWYTKPYSPTVMTLYQGTR